jgi:hypothetical protein
MGPVKEWMGGGCRVRKHKAFVEMCTPIGTGGRRGDVGVHLRCSSHMRARASTPHCIPLHAILAPLTMRRVADQSLCHG